MPESLVRWSSAPNGTAYEVTISPPGSLIGRGPLRALFDRSWHVSVVEGPFQQDVISLGEAIAQHFHPHHTDAAGTETKARAKARECIAAIEDGTWRFPNQLDQEAGPHSG